MGGGARGAPQVLARGLSRVRYVPLAHLPKAARRSALLVQLQAWSPFPECAYAIVARERGALAFAWDRSLFLRRAEAAGLPAEGVVVVPETLLLPRQEAGVSLHRCESGCVAQYWEGGEPLQSRWWAEWPDAEEWLNFQRGVGIASEAQQPPPPRPAEASAWLARPWAKPVDLDTLRGQGRMWEHAVIGALALLLLAPSLWLTRAWQDSGAVLEQVIGRKAELESRVKPILLAREQADAAIIAVQAIARQADRPDALALLVHISRLLPQEGGSIRELEWRGERLHLSLSASPGTSRSSTVKALEAGHWLRDVREAPDSAPGAFSVSAVVAGSIAPTPKAAEATTSPGNSLSNAIR